MSFADQVIQYHQSLTPDWNIPNPYQLLFPFGNPATWDSFCKFFQKYYTDDQPRKFLFGINPGRFGAGITGVPFTDPIRLQEVCHIENNFKKRSELSSIFIYEMIEAYGGVDQFYRQCYITSVSPLGFIANGKNVNYYDDNNLQQAVEPYILHHIKAQIEFGCPRNRAYCLGQGKNYKYFIQLNVKYQWFEEIIPLPHPRWVMQYRRKKKSKYIDSYVNSLR